MAVTRLQWWSWWWTWGLANWWGPYWINCIHSPGRRSGDYSQWKRNSWWQGRRH